MGTKRNPGSYDCYANADPDEPMFVLLGRDRQAAGLVRLWALLRAKAGEDEAKVEEALACARAMDDWLYDKKGIKHGDVDAPFFPLFEQVTTGMDEHPESFDEPCNCDLCLSYGC